MNVWVYFMFATVVLSAYPVYKYVQYLHDLTQTYQPYRKRLTFKMFESTTGRTNRKLYWLGGISIKDYRVENSDNEEVKLWLRDTFQHSYRRDESLKEAVNLVYKTFNRKLKEQSQTCNLDEILGMLYYMSVDSNRSRKEIARNKHAFSIQDVLDLHQTGLHSDVFGVLLKNRYSKEDMKAFIGLPVAYVAAMA